ncbi:immunoglobulin superfamily member 1-like isoform X2 [Hyla sarda]|uniref:immunoglobulin superfamily member 1-like isoform X2 n=1 Tax=Hyla sarda TaxID=327740 RepID=UPI0024C32BB9|nr:immunoglobulin superfamily member 1-like isoform X2 [Hyla sarda]
MHWRTLCLYLVVARGSCILVITQNCVQGEPFKPILERYTDDPMDVDMVGGMVYLICNNSSNAKQFYLRKNGSDDIIKEQSTPIFIMTHLSKSDNGLYTCQYKTTSELSELSDPVYLYVNERYPPPTITAEPQSIVRTGQDVTIMCNSSYPNVIFTLFKGDSQVVEKTANPFIHVIHNMTTEHTGQYFCSYKKLNIQSDFSSPLLIGVKDLQKPSLIWEPYDEEKLNISCTAPEMAKRMWFRLLNESKDVIDERKNVKQNQVDFFVPHLEQSYAIYYCMYRIRIGGNFADSLISDAAVIMEAMFPPPTITAEPQSTVYPGQNVTIMCTSPYPNIVFTLFKGDAVIEENDNNPLIYVIHNAKKEHAGLYSCWYTKFQIQSDLSSPLSIDLIDYTTLNIIRILLSILILVLMTAIVVKHFKSSRGRKSRPPRLPAHRKNLAVESDYTMMEVMKIEDTQENSTALTVQTDCREKSCDEKEAKEVMVEVMPIENSDSLEKSLDLTPPTTTVYATINKVIDADEQKTCL